MLATMSITEEVRDSWPRHEGMGGWKTMGKTWENPRKMWTNVGKTMSCLPPMTGNGKFIPPPNKKWWWLGDGANGIVLSTLINVSSWEIICEFRIFHCHVHSWWVFAGKHVFFVFFLSGDFWVLFLGGEMGMIFSPSWEKQTEMTTFEPPIR